MMQGKTIPRRRVLALGAALAGFCVGCSVLPTAEETAASEDSRQMRKSNCVVRFSI